MSEKAKELICKKETGHLATPEPSKFTIDAEQHKQDIIDAREKRNMNYSEPTVAKPSEVYTPSKGDINADGQKKTLDVSGEYDIKEGLPKPKQKLGKNPSPVPVIDEVY